MNKENCALKLVDEIILHYDARSRKHKITLKMSETNYPMILCHIPGYYTVIAK